jgi:hypothetical protein
MTSSTGTLLGAAAGVLQTSESLLHSGQFRAEFVNPLAYDVNGDGALVTIGGGEHEAPKVGHAPDVAVQDELLHRPLSGGGRHAVVLGQGSNGRQPLVWLEVAPLDPARNISRKRLVRVSRTRRELHRTSVSVRARPY